MILFVVFASHAYLGYGGDMNVIAFAGVRTHLFRYEAMLAVTEIHICIANLAYTIGVLWLSRRWVKESTRRGTVGLRARLNRGMVASANLQSSSNIASQHD
jgi:hypothetical protein